MARTKKKESVDITRFSKEQFLQTKKYIEDKDILGVLLDDDKMYSFEEVDQILKEFLESEV